MALSLFLEWESSRESASTLLARAPELPPRERALLGELVWGVFRWKGRLDWQLAALVSRPLDSLDLEVLWILRMGLYQRTELDRIPAHAAVDTSVRLTRTFGRFGAVPLVNAVLRNAPEKLANLIEPDAADDPIGHLAARTSHPTWLLERWNARFGFRKTLEITAASNRRPGLTLRVTSERTTVDDLHADLREQGIETQPAAIVPECLTLVDGWHPVVGELLENGLVAVQDEAAALVSHAAQPAPGLTVLDVCAAPGGKTLHFANLCGDARIVASDASVRRLHKLGTARGVQGFEGVHLVAADGRQPATKGGFSRVFVDAPCSNTGVFGRRPDARWRRTEDDVTRLSKRQLELLLASRSQVGPGGLLVYSTCSLEEEENEGVLRKYREHHPKDRVVPLGDFLPAAVVRGEYLATDPSTGPWDGMFAAVLQPDAARFPLLGGSRSSH